MKRARSTAFVLALLALGTLVQCDEIPDVQETEGCTQTADCPISQVCDLDVRECIDTPASGAIGTFRCAVVDESGKGYPAKGIGSSQILGLLSSEEGEDCLALVAKSTCIVGKDNVILIAEDPAEASGDASDSFRLSVFASKASVQPGSSAQIAGVFVERYVDADKAYRNYASASSEVLGTTILRFDGPLEVGQFVTGYLKTTNLTLCANNGNAADCFTLPETITDVDYPKEALDPNVDEDIDGDGTPDGEGGTDGGGGTDGEGGDGQGGDAGEDPGTGGDGGEDPGAGGDGGSDPGFGGDGGEDPGFGGDGGTDPEPAATRATPGLRAVAVRTSLGVASRSCYAVDPLLLALMPTLSCSPPDPASPAPPPSAPPAVTVPPAASSAAPPRARVLDYPATRRETIAEEMHGVRVEDPYRWLEDEKSTEVRAWMDTQNQFTRKILDKLPEREAIATRLKELFYIDSLGVPHRYGNRYFYSRRHADKEKAIVYWKEGKKGEEKVLLDPNTWTADGSESLGNWSVSWDGKRVAFTIKKNNSDESTMHVMDVATGKRSEVDAIEGAKYAYAHWNPKGDGFYYAYLPTDKSIPIAERPGYTELRFHKIGDDPKKDTLIHEKTGNPKTFLGGHISKDGRFLLVNIQHGWNATDVYFRDLRDPRQKDRWTPLVVGKDAVFTTFVHKGHFYVHTNDGAPKYRIFKVDPASPARENWKEIVPERKDATLEGVSLVGGKLSLLYLKDVVSQLELRNLDGSLDRVVPLPAPGSSTALIGEEDQDEAYLVFTSLVHPSEIHEISVKKGDPHLFFKAKVPVDPSLFTVEQRFATSRDGTRVPLFIVAKKGAQRDGNAPTLLYGYGGFQVAMQPSFRSSIIPWLERGGVFVMSVLRGGSEYGEEWHRNGMLHKKQNVFDDFFASAEFLISEKYTRPERLAIQGASNGGLLVGAAMTQRPELFRVVLCGVPLLDMVRYHLFGSGKTWIEEYGSAENPEDFKVLHGYSPYHHVKPDTKYPALLMLGADSDDRVDPMHARKFIAQIQEHSTGGPALLRIEKNSGHGGADMLKAAVQKSADELAFALAQMTP